MSDWTEGYVTDISYTYGYYRELNPSRIRMAFLNHGFVAPAIRHACELGYGQGVSVNIHAAASPAIWSGTDFNPSHASFAQVMSAASGADTQLFDEAFEEFARREDLPEFDFIGLHGVWSWISNENRQIIVNFLKKKLKVGGVLYISYNTLPGWTDFLSMRHLMTEHADSLDAPGHNLLDRIRDTMDFMDTFLTTNPQFCRTNPRLADRMKRLRRHNAHYLAHEYFNRDWCPMHFSTMAKWLGEAKLQYACSAHYIDHITPFNLTKEQDELLQKIPDPVFRETLLDFMVNQQFRRDYWIRGVRRLNRMDWDETIRRQQCILVTPRKDIELKVYGSLGEITLNADIYGPVLDIMADLQPRSLGQLEKELEGKKITFSQLYQAVIVLVSMGHLDTVQDCDKIGRVREQCKRLNAFLCHKARGDNNIEYLASPVTGGGYAVNRFQQMFLESISRGAKKPEDWAKYVWKNLSKLDEKLVKEGKTLGTPEENLAELTKQAQTFNKKSLPILQALGIA